MYKKYTWEKYLKLEPHFKLDAYPNDKTRQILADRLDLTPEIVKRWLEQPCIWLNLGWPRSPPPSGITLTHSHHRRLEELQASSYMGISCPHPSLDPSLRKREAPTDGCPS